MPLDTTQRTKASNGDAPSLAQSVARIAQEIAILGPGPAAALRRGPLSGAGSAAFWKLLATHAPAGASDEAGWGVLIQAIAILTPKGAATNKRPAHDSSLPMGEVLQRAGISELRLARLLTAPRDMRRQLSIRICRRLAAAEQRHFDLITLARFVLYGDGRTGRRIARDYFRAEVTAARIEKENTPDA